jgi:hypothetical protein
MYPRAEWTPLVMSVYEKKTPSIKGVSEGEIDTPRHECNRDRKQVSKNHLSRLTPLVMSVTTVWIEKEGFDSV